VRCGIIELRYGFNDSAANDYVNRNGLSVNQQAGVQHAMGVKGPLDGLQRLGEQFWALLVVPRPV
jgi:hypothetical protein